MIGLLVPLMGKIDASQPFEPYTVITTMLFCTKIHVFPYEVIDCFGNT